MSARVRSPTPGAREGHIKSLPIAELETVCDRFRGSMGFSFVEVDEEEEGEDERHFSANIERLVNVLDEHYDADPSLQRSALKQLFLQRQELVEEFHDVRQRLDELFFLRTERYVEKNEKYRCLNRLKTLRNRVNVCEDLSDRDKVLEKLRNRTSVRENVATLASMCKVQFERKKDKAVMSNEDTAKLEAWRSVDDLMEGRDENCVFFVVEDIMEHTFALSGELAELNEDLKKYKRATLIDILKGDKDRKVRGKTALELVEVFETIKCRSRDVLTIEDFIRRVNRIADFVHMENYQRWKKIEEETTNEWNLRVKVFFIAALSLHGIIILWNMVVIAFDKELDSTPLNMTSFLAFGTLMNAAASFCVVMALISNFYATVGGIVGDKLRRESSSGQWRVRRCPELHENEVEVWTNQTNGEVWLHILNRETNQRYWYNEKTKQKSLETPIQVHSEVSAMIDNRFDVLYMFLTIIVCVWMGVTFVGTLYGTHRPSYQYKLDVAQYALAIEIALLSLAATLLATRINVLKYFPEARPPINTYQVASTLRLMLHLNPFITARKPLLKVKYRGDLRGAGSHDLRQDSLDVSRELARIKEGPSWEGDPVLQARVQHLDFSLANMKRLLGELEIENALKVMRIWGLEEPVDVCVAAAHLVIRQEVHRFCTLNRRPAANDNAFTVLAGAITNTSFSLDITRLGDITAELDRLTNTFRELDLWITAENERLDRSRGVAKGQDGTGVDGISKDLELGSRREHSRRSGRGQEKRRSFGLETPTSDGLFGFGNGMARIKTAINNKKKFIEYLDDLLTEKDLLNSRLESKGWKYWGESKVAFEQAPVHEDWDVAARACNAFDVMPAGWVRKFTRSKGWVLQHLHSDRYFLDTPEERKLMANVVGQEVIWGKLWTARNVRSTYLSAVGPYILLPREVSDLNDRKFPIESKLVQAFEGMILDREVKLAQGIRAVKDMDEKLDKDFHALEARYERWNKRKAMSRYGSEREQQAAAHVATSIPGVPSGAGAGGAGAAAAGGSATLTGAAEAVPRTV